jgi:hypothetical protein
MSGAAAGWGLLHSAAVGVWKNLHKNMLFNLYKNPDAKDRLFHAFTCNPGQNMLYYN